MKQICLLLFILFVTTSIWADSFQSRIYKIEKGTNAKMPHLILFENGRTAFLEFGDSETLEALMESRHEGDVLELKVDKEINLISASTVETGNGLMSREVLKRRKSYQNAISYDPTVVSSLSQAQSIFNRMKRSYQNESQCYNRAHIWTYEEFTRSSLNSMKVFLFFTRRYIRNYHYKWWFHVSPMAMVKEGSGVNRRILDRRYTSGPRYVKNWTDIFIQSKRSCPVVLKYSDYEENQYSQDCYLIQVPQFFWQPRDIDDFERTGAFKSNYIDKEVDYAYWEAF